MLSCVTALSLPMAVSPPVWGSPPNAGSMEMLLNSKDRVNTEELYQKPSPTSESLIIVAAMLGLLFAGEWNPH
ncbi:hypothetical protein HPB47_023385 [Ixodes persulcatus]|uniref:Uncharacterized protein n=1 Tax=Ixodes persulcatus TaxID=34615 RepID=A0AC60Q750_IXOPE|nr:hypothetical protein HPB47_023385 [Ixodes persulcatus]